MMDWAGAKDTKYPHGALGNLRWLGFNVIAIAAWQIWGRG